MLLTVMALITTTRFQRSRRWTVILTVCLLVFALGLFIEAIQHHSGRPASVSDLLMNLSGMLCGVCLYLIARLNPHRLYHCGIYTPQSVGHHYR